METILKFFSDLVLFTAGLAVLTMWIVIIIVVIDEIIDLVVNHRNKSEEDQS